jgi:hypothetical protein
MQDATLSRRTRALSGLGKKLDVGRLDVDLAIILSLLATAHRWKQ